MYGCMIGTNFEIKSPVFGQPSSCLSVKKAVIHTGSTTPSQLLKGFEPNLCA